jgi:hypothetical protein
MAHHKAALRIVAVHLEDDVVATDRDRPTLISGEGNEWRLERVH